MNAWAILRCHYVAHGEIAYAMNVTSASNVALHYKRGHRCELGLCNVLGLL